MYLGHHACGGHWQQEKIGHNSVSFTENGKKHHIVTAPWATIPVSAITKLAYKLTQDSVVSTSSVLRE